MKKILLSAALFAFAVLAFAMDSREVTAIMTRGKASLQAGDSVKAMEAFNSVIDVAPDFAQAYVARGQVFQALQAYPEALRDYDKAINLNPNYGEALHYRDQVVDILEQKGYEINSTLDVDFQWNDKTQAVRQRFGAAPATQFSTDETFVARSTTPNVVSGSFKMPERTRPSAPQVIVEQSFTSAPSANTAQSPSSERVVITVPPSSVSSQNTPSSTPPVFCAPQFVPQFMPRFDSSAPKTDKKTATPKRKSTRDSASVRLAPERRVKNKNGTSLSVEETARLNDFIVEGIDLTREGSFAKALYRYNQALAIDGNSAIAYNNRGVVYVKMGDYENALADFEEALAIDPGYRDAARNRDELQATWSD